METGNSMGKEEVGKCPIDHSKPKKSIRASGTFDRSETHTIKFTTPWDDAFDVFQPVPMSEAQPDWWNKLSIYVHDDKFTKQQTGKGCPSMHDIMNTGYIIRTHKTILVVQIPDCEDKEEPYSDPEFQCTWCDETCDPESEVGKRHRRLHNHDQGGTAYVIKDEYVEDMTQYMRECIENDVGRRDMYFDLLNQEHQSNKWIDWRYEITGGHNGGQLLGSDFDQRLSIKFRQPWTISTPEGTSCYWLDPFLKMNDNWTAMQGVIDTDGFNQIDTNCITIIHPLTNENFIIPKGTPIVQIVPFVRTKWKHELELNMDIKQDFMHTPEMKELGEKGESGDGKKNVYRKNFWEVKEFK